MPRRCFFAVVCRDCRGRGRCVNESGFLPTLASFQGIDLIEVQAGTTGEEIVLRGLGEGNWRLDQFYTAALGGKAQGRERIERAA
jgi:hypothetical protein